MSDTGEVYDPDQQPSVLGNIQMPPQLLMDDASQPSILGPALNPQPWTPADSSIHFLLPAADVQTIDLSGIAPPALPQDSASQPPQSGDAGLYNGLTPWQPDPDAGKLFQQGLNEHGYVPQDGDENSLARIIYAESSNTPSDMPAIGWSVVNRVGDPEFGKTLDDVINQKNAFSSVQNNDRQWRGSADPGRLTGPNAKAWQQAQDTAQGIIGGAIPDPVDGGTYFFSSSSYNNGQGRAPGGFQGMLIGNRIVPVNPPGGDTCNYFFKRNPYPPKK